MKHNVYPYWRPAYETRAAAAWGSISLLYAGIDLVGGPGQLLIRSIWLGCLVFCAIRVAQTFAHWERKARLTTLPDYEITGPQLIKTLNRARRLARRGKLRISE